MAVADHATFTPLIVPLADPAICIVSKHVALNVPEPVVPLNDVTAQLKFVHDWAPNVPGTCETVTHVPPSAEDELLGLVTVLPDLKQPVVMSATDATRARNRFMIELAF